MGTRISIRKVEPGDSLKAVFDKNSRLLDQNVRIHSTEQLTELKRQGAKYVLYPDPNSEESSPSNASSAIPVTRHSHENLGHLDETDELGLKKYHNLYQKTLSELETTFQKIHGDNLSADELRLFEDNLENFIQLVNDDPVNLSILTMLEEYNDSTYNHSLNVSVFSILYGKYRGFTESRLLKLAFAALMHDIGKLKIPNKVLDKPEELSDEEFETIKEHSIQGWKLLDQHLSHKTAPQVALEHHERPDGSGYPFGVTSLSEFSRIVAIIDVYEALTAPRVYKRARDPMRAHRALKDEFGDFEETNTICNQLIKALGLLPVGTLVRLSNGQCGIVAENHPSEYKRPKMIVITDETGASLGSNYYQVDLKHSHHQKHLVNNQIYDDNVEITTVESWSDWAHLKDYALKILDESWY